MTNPRPPKRPTNAKTTVSLAVCLDCDWTTNATNALGTAAQHHDTYGHQVVTRLHREIVYGNPNHHEGQTTIDDQLANPTEPTEPTATIPLSP